MPVFWQSTVQVVGVDVAAQVLDMKMLAASITPPDGMVSVLAILTYFMVVVEVVLEKLAAPVTEIAASVAVLVVATVDAATPYVTPRPPAPFTVAEDWKVCVALQLLSEATSASPPPAGTAQVKVSPIVVTNSPALQADG